MTAINIIMPTWNRGWIIDRAIDSVIKQTYSDWKLIIIDDGSVDDTENIVKKHIEHIKDKVAYIKFDRHLGVSFARNAGFYYSEDSEYITFLDSDNWWEPEFLQSNLDFMLNNICDMVYCKQNIYHLKDDDSEILNTTIRDSELPKSFQDINKIDLNQIVIKRNILDKVKEFDESIQRLVDWDFLLRIYANGFLVKNNPVILSNYMMNYNDSITRTEPGGSNAGRIMRKMKNYPWNINENNS